MKTLRSICLSGIVVAAVFHARSSLTLNAAPYASGISSVGGTVTFILNEDADSVKVLFDDGASTNDLGALTKGTHAFSLGTAANYAIVVYKNAPVGWRTMVGFTNNNLGGLPERKAAILQISDNLNPNLVFNAGRGVAINRNPNSPYFGRVYVANSAASAVPYTNAYGGFRVGGVGDGIYILNADLSDALGQGDTAKTAGLGARFTSNGDTPYRLVLGADDRLYVCGKGWGTPGAANLWMTDANVTDGSGTNIFQAYNNSATSFPVTSANTHGGIESAWVSGGLDAGTASFYTVDQDLQSDKDSSSSTMRNSLWRLKNLGWANLPSTAAFSLTFRSADNGASYGSAARVADFDRGGPNDYYYVCIFVDDGSKFWTYNNSFGGGALFTCGSGVSPYTVGLTPGGTNYLAVGMRTTHHVWVYPLDGAQLPRETRRLLLPSGSGQTGTGAYRVRQVKFDAAHNLYVAQDGYGALRVFSPGGASLAVTSNEVASATTAFTVQFGMAFGGQPTNQTVNAGATVDIRVEGDYLATPTYFQWYKDGLPLAAEPGHIQWVNNATMQIIGATCAADAGDYHCVSSNSIGACTSLVATLTVRDPAITLQPVNQTNLLGTTAQFTVTAFGSGTINYQWQRGGVALADGPTGWGSIVAGSSTPTLLITNVAEADATNGSYAVLVSGSGSPSCSTNVVTSSATTLTALVPPVLTVSGDPLAGITLSWPTMVGWTYELQHADDLIAPNWITLQYGSGDGNSALHTDYPPPTDLQRFYRLVLYP